MALTMINADAGGEQGSVAGQIERLTSGTSSEILWLTDHPFYGHSVVTLASDMVVGRRFWSGKVWADQAILEFADIISLSDEGLEQVRVIDANAVPCSIQVAFADYSEIMRRPPPFTSVTMYLDRLGRMTAVLPVQSRPYADPEVERMFDARMREWGIEVSHTLGQQSQTSACTTADWSSRLRSSLLNLA